MRTLADLLEKFKTLRDPVEDKHIISAIIKEKTGVALVPSDMMLRDNKITLKTHPAIRSVIYTNKKQILEAIQAHPELKNRSFLDIV